jgi:hypothetical protein
MARARKSASAQQRIEAIRAERKRLKQELNEKVKAAFAEASRELFESHPGLESFGWRQYSPHFNDGEPCYFRARNEDLESLTINGESGYDLEWYGETKYQPTGRSEPSGWGGTRQVYANLPNSNYDAELTAAADAVLEFLARFDEDDYEEMFGDHVEVTVTRDGVTVDEYTSHD